MISMNKTDQIRFYYETVLSEALKNADLLSADSLKSFNEEILKQYQPESKDAVMDLLNDFVQPRLKEKAKESLALVAHFATEETLKLPSHNNLTAVQTSEIINKAIDKTKKYFEEEHQKYVLYHLEAADIQRGEGDVRELFNVDVPKVILDRVKNEIEEMVCKNPERFVNISDVPNKSVVKTNKEPVR